MDNKEDKEDGILIDNDNIRTIKFKKDCLNSTIPIFVKDVKSHDTFKYVEQIQLLGCEHWQSLFCNIYHFDLRKMLLLVAKCL